MVTLKSFTKRKTKDNRDFITLELVGGLELVQSPKSGAFYATVRRCNIPATFDEQTAAELIGTKLAGNIVRIQSEMYEYKVPSTGEILFLEHSYGYAPTNESVPVGITPVTEVI